MHAVLPEAAQGGLHGASEDLWAQRKGRLKSDSGAQKRYRARQKQKAEHLLDMAQRLSRMVAELGAAKRARNLLQVGPLHFPLDFIALCHRQLWWQQHRLWSAPTLTSHAAVVFILVTPVRH